MSEEKREREVELQADTQAKQNKDGKQEDNGKKKKKGVIIGVLGISVAVAIAATVLGAKGCAPGERSYTVTYLTDDEVQNFNGGSFSVKEGTSIADLKSQLAPFEGYIVDGLFKDKECTERFEDNDKVTGDTTIYVQYKEIEITLIFHNDGNQSDNSFESMTVKYFDKLSGLDFPTPQNYKSDEGSYTFKYWKTLDGKVVDLKSMNSGKDLLAIDADGEIDLYAEFDFEAIKKYTLNFDKGIKVSKADGNEVTSGDMVKEGEVLTVEGSVDDVWTISVGEVSGLTKGDGNSYTVTGGDSETISITSKVEHEYLEFVLKDDQTYEVKGMKKGATETNIVIPDNHYDGKKITSIYSGGYYYSGAFYNNKTIQSVIIGNNVTSIESYVFYHCSGLQSVTIGDNVTSIGYEAFEDCDELASVTIGENVTSIGDSAFIWCRKLTSVTIPNSVTSIGSSAFQYSGLTSVTIGKNVTFIGNSAFRSCANLKNVTIGENVTKIVDYTFNNCNKLTSVTIGKNVTSIGIYAFGDCSGLKTVYYKGDEAGWTTLKSNIGSNNSYLTGAKIYYYEQTNPYTDHEEYEDDKYWHYEGDDTTTPVVWTRDELA